MATRNIVPRVDGEGELGTLVKRWGRFNGRALSEAPAAQAIPLSRADSTLHPGWVDLSTVMSLQGFEILSRFPDGEPESFVLAGVTLTCIRDGQGKLTEIHKGDLVYRLNYDDDGNLRGGAWVA